MEVGRALFTLLCLNFTPCFLLTSASLYNNSDTVVILDVTNFTSIVHNTENAWIIEFYNSWCGHCISFAPIWKEFGKDVKAWEHTVKVGVVDCSVDENMPLCREYEIMAYPTIKMFHAKIGPGDMGTDLHKGLAVTDLSTSLVDFLIEKQKANNGSSSWVNLQPFQGSLADLWREAPSTVEHAVIIVDHPVKHNVAAETILDLGGYSSVLMRYKQLTETGGGTTQPSLITSNRAGTEEVIALRDRTRRAITILLMHKFGLNWGMLPYKSGILGGGKLKTGSQRDEMEGAGDGQPEEINSDKLNYEDDLPDTAFTEVVKDDQVFMVDIENAVSYAVRHEVAQHKIITGEALTALLDFLDVLVRYLPARPPVHNFLSKLHTFVLNSGDTLDGQAFEDTVISLQNKEGSVLPSHQPWIGCQGSEPKYRGYPCGLWTTFHALTVNAVLQDGSKKFYNPKKPLQAIHGFVKHFFSCSHCSQHFQAMYALDAESYVNVADDGILWLWKGHNKVNNRIKGDESEDPKHPKQQFPPKSFCPSCWEGDDKFKESAVLAYLKNIYAKGALSFKGTQSFETEPVKNRQAKVMQELERRKRERNPSALRLIGDQKQLNTISEKQNVRVYNGNWSFNTTDISLCVFLYAVSTVIIMSVYCMVLIRRKLRRRKFIEAYKLPSNAARQPLESPTGYQ
ncbi:hypothetical protein Pmani_014679 [Petrolisthes manimaculis]|uniref:Sulfhydryl oxidase n=1 Tax=Petrolisthes manimaculis TaxID=1843537 RepID=A0AAE1UAQ6_9EUCA|nr:hypothetical protein Pmani_014679 [Petrolisthes manimaculis]